MLDDLTYMRQVVMRSEPNPGEIRRLSNVLRRLLLASGGLDFNRVAPPRIGELLFDTHDVKPLIKANKSQPWEFLSVGGAYLWGSVHPSWALHPGAGVVRDWMGFDNELRIPLKLGTFMDQPVLWVNGYSCTRADLLKYVAHKASGVHSSELTDEKERRINKARHCVSIERTADLGINLNFNPIKLVEDEGTVSGASFDKLDLTLIHLLAITRIVVDSRGVKELEEDIRQHG